MRKMAGDMRGWQANAEGWFKEAEKVMQLWLALMLRCGQPAFDDAFYPGEAFAEAAQLCVGQRRVSRAKPQVSQ